MEPNIRSAIESTINDVLIPTRLIPSWINSLRNLLLTKSFVVTIKQIYAFTTIKKQNELTPGEYYLKVSFVQNNELVDYIFQKTISVTFQDNIDDGNTFSTLYKPIINVTSTPFTLLPTHSNSLIVVDTTFNTTFQLPNNLSVGFNVTVIQRGLGTIIFQPNSLATLFNSEGHNSTKGQYSVCNLYVSKNFTGFSAQYVLAGSKESTDESTTPTPTTSTLSITATSSIQLVEVGKVDLVSSTALVLELPVLLPHKINVGSVIYNNSGASAIVQTKSLTSFYTISNVTGIWSQGDIVYVADSVGNQATVVSQFEGNQGITPFLFTVTRTGNLTTTTTVNWAVTGFGDQPANRFDFQGVVLPSGVLTFLPGEVTKTITVNAVADTIAEPDEAFQVTLFSPQNALISNERALGTIINDDNFFVPLELNQNIIIDQQTRSLENIEETKERLKNTLNIPEAEIYITPLIISLRPINESFNNEIIQLEVSFTERPLNEPDYSFLAKQDENGNFFLLQNNPEPGEVGVVLRDRNQNGRIDGATLYLKDRVSESQTVAETGDLDPRGGFILDPIVPIVIRPTVTDSKLTWLSTEDTGTTQRYFTWLSALDTIDINLQTPFISWLSTTAENENIPQITISTSNLSLPEGSGNTTTLFNFLVVRTRELNTITTVEWAVSLTGVSPATVNDFVGNALPTGSITFQPGQSTRTISVQVQGNTQLESDRSFTLTLSNPTNAEIINGVATGTILNDDEEPTLTIVAVDEIKLEGDAGTTNFLFNVNRSGGLSPVVTVDWAVTGTGGNPAEASDFVNGQFPSGSLTFSSGQPSRSIFIPVLGDTTVETNKTFSVTLTNATNAVITSSTATSTIINDDVEGSTPTTTPIVSWARLLGTAARDEIFAAKTTTDGSIIVAGQTFGNFDDPTLINNTSQVFIAKYTPEGDLNWVKQLNSSNSASNDVASGVDISADGSAIYVVGTTQGNLNGQSHIGGRDAWIAKYDLTGTVAWTRLLGTVVDERATAVKVGTDGFIYVTGSTDGNLDNKTNTGQTDTFIAKYNSAGNKEWVSLLGSSGVDVGYSISSSPEGSVYIAGITTQSISPVTGFGSVDAFLVKYNSNGSRSWVRQLGTERVDQAFAVTTSSDGFIYVAGETQGNLHGELNPSTFGSSFISKYNAQGTREWTRILGSNSIDSIKAVSTYGNFIFVSGFTYGNLDEQTGSGWARAFLSKYNTNGERLWTRLLSSTADTFSNTLTTNYQGAVFVAGRTQSSVLEGQTKQINMYSNFDAFLVKIEES